MREAHCAQATVARLVTFESLKSSYRARNGAQPSHSSTLHFCDVVFAWYLPEMCTARHDEFEVEIFFRDQQRIVYEIRLIAIREVSPPFGEEHRGLEQDISFPGNKHLFILRKCYAVHINASSL